MKKITQVYGIATAILNDSYVDRGGIDNAFSDLLENDIHIGICGQSKCGKSWLRQKWLPDAIVVQCRVNFTIKNIYEQALAILGIKVVAESLSGSEEKLRLQASGEGGSALLAKVSAECELELKKSEEYTYIQIGNNIDDLRFIASTINLSGKRLVIEDFHYLHRDVMRIFANDLKSLWDYHCFVIIVGVWLEKNMILSLNPELSLRIQEVPVDWSPDDLRAIEAAGGSVLKIKLTREILNKLTIDAFGNAGLFQFLLLSTIKEAGLKNEQASCITIDNINFYEGAALKVAEQLDGLYQSFARRVANGIRKRKRATGIYSHLMAVIVSFENSKLMTPIPFTDVYNAAHQREPRIIQGNLKTVLDKVADLQVDEHGRGLVFTFDGENILVVDRNILFYKKYCTVNWPWEQIILESKDQGYQEELDFNS